MMNWNDAQTCKTVKTGLVSVSFRGLSTDEVIAVAEKAGLHGIEWGGDVHVKPGDFENARAVAAATAAHGLCVTSYGSYYRLGTYGEDYGGVIDAVLDTAVALGAPVVRIWGYNRGSAAIDDDTRRRLVAEAGDVAARAAERDLTVTMECHADTVTDEYHAALAFVEDVDAANFKMYWQPNNLYTVAYNKEAAAALRPHLVNVHVFNWPRPGTRDVMANARELWREYAAILTAEGADPWWLLEFMPDDSPASLDAEARSLRELLNE